MPVTDLPTLARGDRRLAYRFRPGAGPTILFLPGYASDMEGAKAEAIDAWAAEAGRAMLRFDYGGCGVSKDPGGFEAQGLNDWLNDTLAMIDEIAQGPVVLAGSSMGGWLMLHAALARPAKVKALVGIAAAPDFTSWGFTAEEKMAILQHGRVARPSEYGAPLVTTRVFWESGEAMRLLHSPIAIDCPVRLIHGQRDEDVPWTWTLELMEKLRSADVQAQLVKDGDHRLSRPQDIALLIATIERLLEEL